MTTQHDTVHSVYISSTADRASLAWCRNTIGISKSDLVICTVLTKRAWSFSYHSIYIHGGCTDYCVVGFVDPRHKLLFDLAWGHLGIHDSVAALEAAQVLRGLA